MQVSGPRPTADADADADAAGVALSMAAGTGGGPDGSVPESGIAEPDAGAQEAAAAAERAAESRRRTRQLRNGVVSLVLLVALVACLLLAVPGLQGVSDRLQRANLLWVVLAVVLQLASCIGYVWVFELVFPRTPHRLARRVALAEMAFGAVIPAGGAGGAAIGVWLMKAKGLPLPRVAERSAVLFLLTSAVNVIVLAATGIGVAVHLLPGPRDALLTWLPGGVGVAVLLVGLALPRLVERQLPPDDEGGRWVRAARAAAGTIRNTESLLRHPRPRLIGAFAYLLCDIAVLWAAFRAFGDAPAVGGLILAYQIGYLVNIVPVPGGIGILDGGMIAALALYGAPATGAVAAVLIYHAVWLWVPVVLGSVAFLLVQRTINEPVELLSPAQARGQRRFRP